MKIKFLVCGDVGCLGNGSQKIYEMFQNHKQDWFEIKLTGCQGFCAAGPVIQVQPGDIFYQKVKPDDVEEIIEKARQHQVVDRLLWKDAKTREKFEKVHEIPFYRKQKKIVLNTNGQVDPESIDDYLDFGGYDALKKTLTLHPEDIVNEIIKSGLRGRGGGGFSTGRKWKSIFESEQTPKYVLCNGDEGDPGAFMDRSVMQGTPHLVLEGMAIAAYAVGSTQGYIYVRDEYPIAIKNLRIAIDAAKEKGFLGDQIMGTDFSFDIKIKRGAGAFVCGESSALMRSIEGKIGEPNEKYVHAAEAGLWKKPSLLNNVETFANVPYIILNGADKYRELGTEGSPGTKVFSLVGKIKNAGLIEVPMGIALREIIYDVGGGISKNRPFKAVQTGGPSGGCIPIDYMDLPIDYDSLTRVGSMMGSGGMIVMDDCDCMVELARYFTRFLMEESCGKCTPCREGLMQVYSILERITRGEGRMEDIELLEELGEYISESALCGLGKSAPNPLLSTLRYFKHEYIDHIENKHCTAGVCKRLTRFEIDPEACKKCGACYKACVVSAIEKADDGTYKINQDKCVKCGECRLSCNFNAITW